jgi:hypothetical protein
LAADLIGDSAPLRLDPVNFWMGALIFAVAIDLNRPDPFKHRPGR